MFRLRPSVHLSLRTSPQTGVAIPRSVAPCSDFGSTVTLPRLRLLPRRTRVQGTGGLPRRLRLLAMTACFSALAQRLSRVGADVGHGLASLLRFGPFLHLSLRTSAAALVWQSPPSAASCPGFGPPSTCHCEPVRRLVWQSPGQWLPVPTSGVRLRCRGWGCCRVGHGCKAPGGLPRRLRLLAMTACFSALAQVVGCGCGSGPRCFFAFTLRTYRPPVIANQSADWCGNPPDSGISSGPEPSVHLSLRSQSADWRGNSPDSGCASDAESSCADRGDCHVGFASSQ